jgi:hypothetical protein
MAKLDPSDPGPALFAPIVFRLAMKLEQVRFSEFAGDPTEAVYVLRAAQRLFRLDAVPAWFDTWLEAEAAGAVVERDDAGHVVGTARPPASLRPVSEALSAPPIAHAVEIVRRLSVEIGAQVPLAMLSAGATLCARLGSPVDYARELSVGLARVYCEADAGALLLVQEEPSPDLDDLAAFGALFNLAAYYATPVVLVSRHPLSPQGLAVAERMFGGLYVTPTQAGAAVLPLSHREDPLPRLRGRDGEGANARLALTRWEVDPGTAPETVHAWRGALAAA